MTPALPPAFPVWVDWGDGLPVRYDFDSRGKRFAFAKGIEETARRFHCDLTVLFSMTQLDDHLAGLRFTIPF